ncbi:PREDICTED: codanin-1 [Papilio polytes]|uniref:codanin-1 n=1 Tax=Papilio polytes TaxID=76194 RepID=UPI0006763DEF|nr:PREDICTED: codanin-1 [Papilio polytes]
MPETIIESVLTKKLDTGLLIKWLNNESIEEAPKDCILLCCSKSEFVAHFLSYIRSQTDSILQTNSNAIQLLQQQPTPEKILSRRKHRRSVSDPTSDTDRTADSLSVKTDHQSSQGSPNRDRKKTGRKVKTKLFPDDKIKDPSVSPDESRICSGVNRLVISSTPVKNGYKNEYPNITSPVTPNYRSFKDNYERCDTPRISHRHSRSQEKNISLGDFLVNAQPKSGKKKRGKNTSDDNDIDTKVDLDLSNSEMFPEIGARKSSSLRSERRRIKPTNLDKSSSQKSFSLNNFNVENFQSNSPLALEENSAFKYQKVQPNESSNSFEIERNILKQERHKLMEKFNILNTSTSPKIVTAPQIKVTRKESMDVKQRYITANANSIVHKEWIDIFVEIYDTILKNNLVLSLNTELYFLVSILLSKQFKEDNATLESQLDGSNVSENLLKSIHNSTYFAVKSLWCQRTILEVILDKNSLKILGENKKVRSFYPELAKFLLNSYGLKVEAEINQDKSKMTTECRASNGVICFNFETDNADNFPSLLSFQNFKKQRDMFYEILRWYQDTQTTGGSRTTFKARIKTLLASGPTAANHAHLAALFTAHMIAECLPPTLQESKMSKLHRRLTCPNAPETHRLPLFSDKEIFYKDFIMYAENESFRVHLRDAFSTEIIVLDASSIATESSNESEISKEFLQLSKKLCLLSKFLGYLTSLPYSQVPADFTTKTGALIVATSKEVNYAPPKEKVLENNLALRNYSQPSIDLSGIIINSDENGRLCITVPWIVHYLSMLDYTTLRIKYYQNLLKLLFNIYEMKLKIHPISLLKKNTVIFLKSILGWLFDLPHFPQEFFYESITCNVSVASENAIDYYDLIDESILFELCPILKDVNVLLSTCKVSHDQKDMGSFRHITPVSLSLNMEDRMRNKEKELQARLEEEFLKTQPSSSRRVLELVMERVTSGAVKEVAAQLLAQRRATARDSACALVNNTEDSGTLLKSLEALYNSELQQLRGEALSVGTASIKRRAGAALAALLPAAPSPLLSLAVKGCVNRLNKWLNDNWSTTAILCKDIQQEMKTLQVIGEAVSGPAPAPPDLAHMMLPDDTFEHTHVSPAVAVINLKEHTCMLLDYDDVPDATALLASCALACSPTNIFSRPPTQRALLQLSVDYCIVFVSRKPEQVDDVFLNKLHAIWNTCCPDRPKQAPQEILLPERRSELSPQFRNFEDEERAPTPLSDDDNEQKIDGANINMEKIIVVVDVSSPEVKNASLDQSKTDRQEENPLLKTFDRVLCPRNIVLLSQSRCAAAAVWQALATLLVFLLKNDYLSEDSLTEQCLAVYRQDWPQNILENLSTCMKSVSSRWSRAATGKFTLFLDFLAEYCGDMDYDPIA